MDLMELILGRHVARRLSEKPLGDPPEECLRPTLWDVLDPRPERIYLPIHKDNKTWALGMPGAHSDERGDIYVVPGEPAAAALEPYLPVAYRPGQPGIAVDLIPSSSWGASLANLLSWRSWQELRQPVFEAWGGRCCVCGCNDGAGESKGEVGRKGLDCHEIWQYDEEHDIQKLTGLVPICEACHECFHLGRAAAHLQGGPAGTRLAGINGWTPAEAQAAIDDMFKTHAERSKRFWTLDLSLVASRRLYFKDDRGQLVNVVGARILPGKERPRYGADGRIYLDIPPWHRKDAALIAHLNRGTILPPAEGLKPFDPACRFAFAPPPQGQRGTYVLTVPMAWAAPWMILEGRQLSSDQITVAIDIDPLAPPEFIPAVQPPSPSRGSDGAAALAPETGYIVSCHEDDCTLNRRPQIREQEDDAEALARDHRRVSGHETVVRCYETFTGQMTTANLVERLGRYLPPHSPDFGGRA